MENIKVSANGVVHEKFKLSDLRRDAMVLVIGKNEMKQELISQLVDSLEQIIYKSCQDITNYIDWNDKDANDYIIIDDSVTRTKEFQQWTHSEAYCMFLTSNSLRIVTTESIMFLPEIMRDKFDFVFVLNNSGCLTMRDLHHLYFIKYPTCHTLEDDMSNFAENNIILVKDHLLDKIYYYDFDNQELEQYSDFLIKLTVSI